MPRDGSRLPAAGRRRTVRRDPRPRKRAGIFIASWVPQLQPQPQPQPLPLPRPQSQPEPQLQSQSQSQSQPRIARRPSRAVRYAGVPA